MPAPALPPQKGFRVVKEQRGGDGQWFRHAPGRTRHETQAEAEAAAAAFAADQAGVAGTRIAVLRLADGVVVKRFPVAG